jgi:transporter family-2 protein
MPVAVSGVLIALAGGIAIGLQSLFSGVLGHRVGVMESVLIVHIGGLVLAGLILLFMRGGNLAAWRAVPWYVLCAGFLGVVIIGSMSYAVPRLGLATTLTLAIIAQLVLGALLDHFGLFGAVQRSLGPSRAIGIAVLLVGTWLIVR